VSGGVFIVHLCCTVNVGNLFAKTNLELGADWGLPTKMWVIFRTCHVMISTTQDIGAVVNCTLRQITLNAPKRGKNCEKKKGAK